MINLNLLCLTGSLHRQLKTCLFESVNGHSFKTSKYVGSSVRSDVNADLLLLVMCH